MGKPQPGPSFYSNLWSQYPNSYREKMRQLIARCLTLLFINFSIWILAALTFKIIEGGLESTFKCGVKRVRRDFIETLWNETLYFDESDWKSSARRRLIEFENELHQAVEAGIHTYSGQTSWSLPNAFLYSFSVASTIGYGSLTASTTTGRLVSVIYSLFSTPIFFLLILEVTQLAVTITFLLAKYWVVEDLSEDQKEKGNQRSSNWIFSKLKEVILNWQALDMEPFNFNQLQMPPALSAAFFLCWSALTSFIYSATFLAGPVDSIYAVLSTTTTVGYADTEHEDHFFFLVTSLNVLLGMILFFIYQISVQRFLRNLVNQCLTSMSILQETKPSVKSS